MAGNLAEKRRASQPWGPAIALCMLLAGCASDRFRLANREDTGYERSLAQNEQLRVPRAPGAVGGYEGPPSFAGVPAPHDPFVPSTPDRLPIPTTPREQFAATLPAQPSYPPSAAIPGLTSPMPGGAISAVGTELVGRVVAPTGQPAPRVPVQVHDSANLNTLVAEVATDGEGVFRVRNLQPGTRYRLTASSQARDGRLSGSVNTVAPDPSVVLQLQLDNAYSGLSPLGNRLGTGGVIPRNNVPASPAPSATAGNVTVATVRPVNEPTPVSMGRVLPPSSTVPSVSPDLATRPERSAPTPSVEPENSTEFSGAKENLPLEFPKEDLDLPNRFDSSARQRSNPGMDRPGRVSSAFAGTELEYARVYDLDGSLKPMGALSGNLIVIDFFGTWCGPCRRAIPHLNEIAARYSDRGVQIVGIACERGDVSSAIESASSSPTELGTKYPIVVSPLEEQSPVREYFHVRAYPTVILIDRAGKVYFQATGGDAATFRRLESAIQEALQTVSVARAD